MLPRKLISLVILLMLPMLTLPAQQQSGVPAAWRYNGESGVATGQHAMVVSSSPIASAVGRDILRAGGNAIDAAAAVGFALAVTHPAAGNIGGGGFMVIRLHNGITRALDYRETAPSGASRDMYLDAAGNLTNKSLVGHLAAGVPGSVAGMLAAQERYGKLSRKAIIDPAIKLARDGFVLNSHEAGSLRSSAKALSQFEASAKQFLVDGKGPANGATLKQPDLARTLEAIRDRGAAGFYSGWVADSIAAEMQRGGGLITKADLAAYRPIWRDPIRINYRHWTIWSMPPASSGGATLAMILNILEKWNPLPPFGSAQMIHLEAEAMRRAFTDRNRYMGDPGFEDVPLAWLISKAHADTLRSTINPDSSSRTPPFDPRIVEGNNTTHYSVVDAEGNAVSTTTTLNFSYGSKVTVRGAGFLLNDEMDDFAAAPGKPNGFGLVQGEVNAIQPGKRPLSAMTPSIVLDPNGALKMVVGTPGGPTIITQVYHVISNVIDHKMLLADAVAAPRTHHQALPDQIRMEGPDGFFPATLARLKAMGHRLRVGGSWGTVEAIIRKGNSWVGVSDPRSGGGGSGY